MTDKITSEQIIAILAQYWPEAFNEQYLPLKCHIYQDIIQEIRARGLNLKASQVYLALRRYTSSKRYHFNMLNTDYRIHLDGGIAEKISSAHKRHARQLLVYMQKRSKSYAFKKATPKKRVS